MKGIIIEGGSGTRLYPLTISVSKQLMPVFDKPMIYCPLSTLLLAGISDILIIKIPQDQESFIKLLNDGYDISCTFSYVVQETPNGLTQAFVLGEKFIGNDKVALVLGGNIFYDAWTSTLLESKVDISGGCVFAYQVQDPEGYRVVEFDNNSKAISIEEKPSQPKSNYAIPGLYFYNNSVVEIVKNIQLSARGEYEITDVNKVYLVHGNFSRATAWLDKGTLDSLHEASEFVNVIEKRQGFKISCIEEVAYRKGFISQEQLIKAATRYRKSGYGDYKNN